MWPVLSTGRSRSAPSRLMGVPIQVSLMGFREFPTPEVPRTRRCPGPLGLAYGGDLIHAGAITSLCTIRDETPLTCT